MDPSIPVMKHDLTKHVGGSNRFLLRMWVDNSSKQEILALDHWALQGVTGRAR